jgi:hypothetical protein
MKLYSMKIKIKNINLEVELTNKNPITVEKILEALPIESSTNRWGDEIYFETDVEIEEENPQQEVEIGDVTYWPPGKAICIFFGRTPVSTSNKPKAYSAVNVFGKVVKNLELLKKIRDDEKVEVCK